MRVKLEAANNLWWDPLFRQATVDQIKTVFTQQELEFVDLQTIENTLFMKARNKDEYVELAARFMIETTTSRPIAPPDEDWETILNRLKQYASHARQRQSESSANIDDRITLGNDIARVLEFNKPYRIIELPNLRNQSIPDVQLAQGTQLQDGETARIGAMSQQ